MAVYLVVCAVSFLLCAGATRLVRDFAAHFGYVSTPASDRHIHRVAVPRLGGIAIFGTVASICLFFRIHRLADVNVLRLTAILLAGAIVFAIGLVDDLRSVKPYSKICAQVISASIFFSSGPSVLHFHAIFGSGRLATLVGLLATVVWVVVVSNAFNLIDGLDGLAAGSALCSTATLFIISLFTQHHFISLITSSLGGAILGFLMFNFSPATIFLGDCGSLFLGVVLAECFLTVQSETPVVVGLLLPVCCFALPLLDTALAIFRRILNGQAIFMADKEHIHHKLLARGFSQRQTVLLLFGVSSLCSCSIWLLIHLNGLPRSFVVSGLAMAVFAGLLQLRYREFRELQRLFRRIAIQGHVVKHDLALRRATERLQGEPDIEGICRVLVSVFEPSDFDGFTLRLQNVPSDGRNLLYRTDAGHFSFEWRKPEDGFSNQSDWQIQLPLGPVGEEAGVLIIYRRSINRPLLVDPDIVTNDLRRALFDAVERVCLKSHRPPPRQQRYHAAGAV